MMTLKKRKSSTSLHIVHPNALAFYRNETWTGESAALPVVLVASLAETPEMPVSKHPESNNIFSNYITDQTDTYNNCTDMKGKDKTKQ